MNNPWKVLARAFHLADNIIRIIPAIKSPETSIKRNSPLRSRGRSPLEPIRMPPRRRQTLCIITPPRHGHHNPQSRNGQKPHKLQKHEQIARPRAQLGTHAIQPRDDQEPQNRHSLVNPLPGPGFLPYRAPESPNDILPEDNRDNRRTARFQHSDRTPREQEPRPLPEDLGQVDLGPSIQGDGAAKLGIARRAGPGQQAGDEPDEEGGGGRAGVGGDGGRGGEDSGADDEADDEGEAVEVGEGLVLLERVVGVCCAGVCHAGAAEGSIARTASGCAAAARGRGGEREEGGVEVEGAGDGVGAGVGTGALGVLGVVVGGGEGEFAAGGRTAGGGRGGVVFGSVVMVGGGERGEFEAVAGRMEGGRWVLILLLDHFGRAGGGHPLPSRGTICMYILREVGVGAHEASEGEVQGQ
ncbi:amino acid transporter [Hortaea werneckii]|nr:amino acid transporter [Hortaea werneckii]